MPPFLFLTPTLPLALGLLLLLLVVPLELLELLELLDVLESLPLESDPESLDRDFRLFFFVLIALLSEATVGSDTPPWPFTGFTLSSLSLGG